MSGALRSIAISVEEVEPGAFEWVLFEQGVEWAMLKRSDQATDSYAKSMAAGLLALQHMIVDLDAGPREAEIETRPPERAAFGFGFGGLK